MSSMALGKIVTHRNGDLRSSCGHLVRPTRQACGGFFFRGFFFGDLASVPYTSNLQQTNYSLQQQALYVFQFFF